MYLIGDSPMGYRLPLDSLPWVSKSDYPTRRARPMAPRGPASLADLQNRYAVTYLAGSTTAGP